MSCYEFLLLCFWAELHSSLCVKLKPILRSLCWNVVWFNPFCNLTHNVQVSKAIVHFWALIMQKSQLWQLQVCNVEFKEYQIKVSHPPKSCHRRTMQLFLIPIIAHLKSSYRIEILTQVLSQKIYFLWARLSLPRMQQLSITKELLLL